MYTAPNKDPRVDPARQAPGLAVGNAQLPEVIIEIDHLTRFSWTLLGRPTRSERELVTLYAGLIGLGSDLTVAELVRMVPALAADSLGQMVLRIEAEGRLRAANDAVLRFTRGHRIAGLWGSGLFASADMMSLEATRYLWAARLDFRRRTHVRVPGVPGATVFRSRRPEHVQLTVVVPGPLSDSPNVLPNCTPNV